MGGIGIDVLVGVGACVGIWVGVGKEVDVSVGIEIAAVSYTHLTLPTKA